MKILFVYPNLMRQEYIPLGLAYLSAYVKAAGHETALMDYTWGGSQEDCIAKIEETKPDFVGFSLRSGELDFSLKIAEKIKQHYPELPIIFGGVHPTVAPEETLQYPQVDMICRGEGEIALKELLDKAQAKKEIYSTPNFWFKKENKTKDGITEIEIIRNPPAPLIDKLDQVPFPDRELFGFEKYLAARSGAVDLMAGRGCPFGCAYCINHILQDLNKDCGSYVRMRSADSVIAEIRMLKEKYGITFINFEDDTFTLNKKWMAEFAEKYSAEFAIPFSCNARTETIDREMCGYLKKAGCKSLHMGIESGSEKIRREVLNRHMTNQQIINAFATAKEFGIATASFNMIGSPYETLEDMEQTLELNKKINPDFVDVSIFQPYPGTRLYYLCKEKGWLKKEGALPFSHKFVSILEYPHISSKQIKKFRQKFRYEILKQTNPLKAVFTRVLDSNYELYIKTRNLIPSQVKAALFRFLRK